MLLCGGLRKEREWTAKKRPGSSRTRKLKLGATSMGLQSAWALGLLHVSLVFAQSCK